MIGLNRDLAPMSDKAWERLESEARDVLSLRMAARRLVDFEVPRLGGRLGESTCGRAEPLEGASGSGAMIRQRVVRPLIELRVPFDDVRRRGAEAPSIEARRASISIRCVMPRAPSRRRRIRPSSKAMGRRTSPAS